MQRWGRKQEQGAPAHGLDSQEALQHVPVLIVCEPDGTRALQKRGLPVMELSTRKLREGPGKMQLHLTRHTQELHNNCCRTPTHQPPTGGLLWPPPPPTQKHEERRALGSAVRPRLTHGTFERDTAISSSLTNGKQYNQVRTLPTLTETKLLTQRVLAIECSGSKCFGSELLYKYTP